MALKILPNRIKELREAQKLTQEELGLLVGIDFTSVAKHENMQRGIDETLVQAYARVFKVLTHEIFVDPSQLGDTETE